jgi:glutamine synthetase
MESGKKYVLETAREQNVKFIKLWFTDILGYLKSFAITFEELEGALESGMGFDGSSIEGFARIDESDMIAMPDPSTFQLIPFRPTEGGAVARMFCDVQLPTGEPYVRDPRYVLRKMLAKAEAMGYTYYVGPELEYFYFASDKSPEVLDQAGYFDMVPADLGVDLRRQTVFALEAMGITVEYSHHEVAPSQHEIDLRYTDALTMADSAMTYRLIVKEIARMNGCYATFMPKPLSDQNGSGMHTHQSLFEGDRNAFFDAQDEMHLSQTARYYIGGIMKYAPEICLITNQWVNSYKRLVPGFEAPVYISWARRNRSDMIRVPEYKPGKEKATRIEFRAPDPACNPYLAFAAMLAAGLKGIEDKLDCGPAVEENVYKMSQAEREARGIASLPGSLHEAIIAAEKSELLRECLGEAVHTSIVENKYIEWDSYRKVVDQYEIDTYMPKL